VSGSQGGCWKPRTSERRTATLWFKPCPFYALSHTGRRALAFNFATIDVPGARDTFSYGVNAEGDIVGSYEPHGFLLHQGTFTAIDFPGAIFTDAFGINDEGDIVGRYIPAGGSGFFLNAQGFLLHQGIFTTIAFPGAVRTEAFGINSQGDIVGFYDLPGAEPPSGPIPPARPFHGFLLHQGTFTTIDFPGAFLTEAQGINPSGDIVGLYSSSDTHGFLLHQGAFTTIDLPGAFLTEAHGINSNGDIVGLYNTSSGLQGFLLHQGTLTTIDVGIGNTNTAAFGINLQGNIVGVYSGADSLFHGFLGLK
jgi:uncharacterized membrane protein